MVVLWLFSLSMSDLLSIGLFSPFSALDIFALCIWWKNRLVRFLVLRMLGFHNSHSRQSHWNTVSLSEVDKQQYISIGLRTVTALLGRLTKLRLRSQQQNIIFSIIIIKKCAGNTPCAWRSVKAQGKVKACIDCFSCSGWNWEKGWEFVPMRQKGSPKPNKS